MQATVEIFGKRVAIEWSAAAAQAMNVLGTPLLVEMELYFSCLIRKAVRFNFDASADGFVSVTPQLKVRFRPVMTKACAVGEARDTPPLGDFPIAKPEAFVPRRLAIDHRGGRWIGEFTI